MNVQSEGRSKQHEDHYIRTSLSKKLSHMYQIGSPVTESGQGAEQVWH